MSASRSKPTNHPTPFHQLAASIRSEIVSTGPDVALAVVSSALQELSAANREADSASS